MYTLHVTAFYPSHTYYNTRKPKERPCLSVQHTSFTFDCKLLKNIHGILTPIFLNLNKFLTLRQCNFTTVMYTYEKFPTRYLQLVKQQSFRRPVKPHSVQVMFTTRLPLSKYKTRLEFK